MNIISIISLVVVNLIVVIGNVIGMIYTSWTTQLNITMI